jgi:hypothetical protein
MSANHGPDYPDELKLSVWDKKKGSLPSGHDVGSKLKALQKKHEAVDWKLFDTGWSKAAKTAEELDEAFAQRDRLYRGSVFALKKDALAVASAAKAMEKEKGAAKPVIDAAKAITKAANGFADDVDKGIDDLKASYDKALGALPKKADAKGGEDGEDDEPGSVLLDPKRLVAQLKQCQRTPDRTVQFAFVDAVGKDQPAVMAMHAKMTSTSLFNKLKQATGSKTGAYGSAWVDGTSLMLQLDKPLGGLVKKARAAVKAAGFRVAKVVLWQEDGTVFEQDDAPDDDAGADTAAASATADAPARPGAPEAPAATSIPPAPPGGPAAKKVAPAPATPSAEAAAFTTRLKALLAKAAEAGNPSLAQQAKMLGSEAGVFVRKGDWAQVDKLMAQAEALFGPPRGTPGTPQAEARAEEKKAEATPGTGKTEEELDAAWQARFATTEKVYLAVMASQPADASKLRALMDFANGKALAKQYAAASQTLDRLDGMLAKLAPAASTAPGAPAATETAATTGGDTGITPGLVAYRKTLLALRSAVATIDGRIDALRDRIANSESDESDLEELANELADHLHEWTGDLLDAVDIAMGAVSNVTDPVPKTVAGELERFEKELNGDLVKHVDANKFKVATDIAGTLGSALAAVRKAMPVPA